MPTTTFPAVKLQRVRAQAARLSQPPVPPPQGWSISSADPMAMLKPFTPLRLRDGFVLRAYQFCEGGNGNGFVWALPEEAELPEPEACPRLEDGFLRPPRPSAALGDLMEAIEGDGTPWSYACASLFRREAEEFGAMWHGCNWSTHTIVGSNPAKRRGRRDRARIVARGKRADEWTWLEPAPKGWKPQVLEDAGRMSVIFYTTSQLGSESITRHEDIFNKGSYVFETHDRTIATGGPGYVF